ncbi:MAG: TraG/TraD/VirD4 family protein, partial [Planococcus donghaensis]
LGRNIRFNIVIQAYSQLEKLYGDDWKTIDGNTNNTFYILTDDHTTAEMISKKIGEKTQVVKSRSGETLSLGKSKTENVEARPLLNADELMRLKEGEMIVIRTIKRQDKDRKRIKQFPIFNTDNTSMKYRWEYLSEYYDTSNSINDIDIECLHADLDLTTLRVDFSKAAVATSSDKKVEVVPEVVSSFERKPPKPKAERLKLAMKEQERLIEEKAAESPSAIITGSAESTEKTTGSSIEENEELPFNVPETKPVDNREEKNEELPIVIPENITTGSSIEENEELPFIVPETKEVEQEEELPFIVPETKTANSLNEILFRANIIEGSFDEIYQSEFKYLSIEEVKELLVANKEKYKENYFNKLLAIVEEKLEYTMR